MPRLRIHISDGSDIERLTRAVNDLGADLRSMRRHLERNQEAVMAELDQITAAVEANGQVEASAIALIQGLADRLDNIDTTDPAAITALAEELRSQSDALAAAVVANTPADTGGDTGPGTEGEPA